MIRRFSTYSASYHNSGRPKRSFTMEEIDLLTIRERLMTQAFLDAMPI